MKAQKEQSMRMLQGPLLPAIISYTVPIILTSILQLLFNAADLVIVGRWCGSVAVAAVGSTGAITNLIVNLFIGLSVGSGVTMAHALGGRDSGGAHRTVHTTLPVALISGVILTVVGVLLSEPLLRLMGNPEDVLPFAAKYMRIYFCGITFTMVYNFCASILRVAGDTRPVSFRIRETVAMETPAFRAISTSVALLLTDYAPPFFFVSIILHICKNVKKNVKM